MLTFKIKNSDITICKNFEIGYKPLLHIGNKIKIKFNTIPYKLNLGYAPKNEYVECLVKNLKKSIYRVIDIQTKTIPISICVSSFEINNYNIDTTPYLIYFFSRRS